MTYDNDFEAVWRFIQKWEGGSLYTNDPKDKGGPTKYGIALNYNKPALMEFCGSADALTVRNLTEDTAKAIFHKYYYKKYKCDQIRSGLGLYYTDCCFNPGPGVSVRFLQEAVNAANPKVPLVVDGLIGPKTIAEANGCMQLAAVRIMHDKRMAYYRSRDGWSRFGKGWTNRANDGLSEAIKLINRARLH